MIRQGDLYWDEEPAPVGSEPGYTHPVVVVQNNVFNASRIDTTVVCLLTSNVRLASRPGNVLLRVGEGSLSKQSVVNVSQLFTVDRRSLGPYIGTLSPRRVQEILRGIGVVLEPREIDEDGGNDGAE